MFLYRLLAPLALLLYAPVAWLRSLAGGRRLGDIKGRLGKTAYPGLSGGVWVHAVSVGEVGVARSLLGALERERPGTAAGLSVTTAAGRELAERTFPRSVPIFAFPFDLAGPVEAALTGVRPGLVVLTETEIWPLFLERAAAREVPVALVNGRLSTRSFRGYSRVRGFLLQALRRIRLFAMQTAADAERIQRLGAPADRIHVTGNIKYDLSEAPAFADAARLSEAGGGRPIFVAASTGEGEEALLLDAWRPFAPRALLALAPRRPERFDSVASLVQRRGYRLIRRSSQASAPAAPPVPAVPSVYLLDTIGELPSLYREGSLAFVGGSFVATGGHNPIEAWAAGAAVLTGPHMENFREIAKRGEQEGFLDRLSGPGDLPARLDRWLSDPAAAQARGQGARRFVEGNRGAARATVRLLLPLLEPPRLGRRAGP